MTAQKKATKRTRRGKGVTGGKVFKTVEIHGTA